MFSKIKGFLFHKDEVIRDDRKMFVTVLITSLLSLFAAFVLSVEAVQLAANPNIKLGCSINVFINCATVANSKYAALFGFPNSFMGLIGETVFVVIAVACLMDAKFTKKFWFLVQAMAAGALVFALTLFYISSFLIQVICPWCMLVLASTIVMFFAISRYNIRKNNLYLPAKTSKKMNKFIDKSYDKLVMAVVFVIIISFIIIKYGNGLFA